MSHSPRARLQQTARFLAIRRHGRWARGRGMHVGVLPNDLPITRLGLRVQRSVSTAVERNRAKRVLRSAYRDERVRIRNGYDVLVVLCQQKQYLTENLRVELIELLTQLDVMNT